MKYLKIFFQILFSFFFSGSVYCTIELIYRQYTHFSMFILAGVVGIFLYFLNNIFTYEMDYLLQIIIGTVFATLGEGTVGTILQKLHNGINPVWDYSNMPLSFFNGQCCALFTFFWLLIIAPSIILLDIYDWKIFNGEAPYYKIFGHIVLKFKEKMMSKLTLTERLTINSNNAERNEPTSSYGQMSDYVPLGFNDIIDVSSHNGHINWEVVKNYISGVILRLGYGDDISSQDDKEWLYNISEVERLGIPWGAYLYSYAKSTLSAQSEARHAIRLLQGHHPSLPIYFDSEEKGTESVARKNYGVFKEMLNHAGYEVDIYASESWYNSHLKGEGIAKWIAKYGKNNGQKNSKPNVADSWLWQYTSNGSVDGIKGRVDMNTIVGVNPVPYVQPTNNNRPVEATPSKIDIYYSVFANGKWLPEVKNTTDYAGIQNVPIKGIKMRVTNGSIKYRVHLKGRGWLPYVTGCDANDKHNGFAGTLTNDIDAIEAYYSTPSDYTLHYGYKSVIYQVSTLKTDGYYTKQIDNSKKNGMDGYAGWLGKSIDCVKMYIG